MILSRKSEQITLMQTEPTQIPKNENTKSLFEQMIKVSNQIINNEAKLSVKDEVLKILELDNDKLKDYVDKKINFLNKNTKESEILKKEVCEELIKNNKGSIYVVVAGNGVLKNYNTFINHITLEKSRQINIIKD